jgi:Tfp pilus assembly PilM family ATPase
VLGTAKKKGIFNFTGKGLFRPALPAAIEFSSGALKLLQLARRGRGYAIAKCDYQPLDIGAAPPEAALKEALEKLIKANNLSGKTAAALGLSRIQASSYILPQIPEEEAAAAVAWKARQGLPQNLNLTDLSLDYLLIESPAAEPGPKEAVALVFMARKKQITDLAHLFRACGLELILVAPKPYVLVKVMYALQAIKPEEAVLIVDIGEDESSVTIACAGYPFLIRSLLVSGRGLAEAAGSASQQGLSEAASSQLEGLVVDLEHTFKYFSHELVKSRVVSFDRVLLCGEAGRKAGLSRFIFEKLGVATDIFDPAPLLKSLARQQLSQPALERLADFGAVLGLAAEFSDGKLKAD